MYTRLWARRLSARFCVPAHRPLEPLEARGWHMKPNRQPGTEVTSETPASALGTWMSSYHRPSMRALLVSRGRRVVCRALARSPQASSIRLCSVRVCMSGAPGLWRGRVWTQRDRAQLTTLVHARRLGSSASAGVAVGGVPRASARGATAWPRVPAAPAGAPVRSAVVCAVPCARGRLGIRQKYWFSRCYLLVRKSATDG